MVDNIWAIIGYHQKIGGGFLQTSQLPQIPSLKNSPNKLSKDSFFYGGIASENLLHF